LKSLAVLLIYDDENRCLPSIKQKKSLRDRWFHFILSLRLSLICPFIHQLPWYAMMTEQCTTVLCLNHDEFTGTGGISFSSLVKMLLQTQLFLPSSQLCKSCCFMNGTPLLQIPLTLARQL
jgi:hypothetical protein